MSLASSPPQSTLADPGRMASIFQLAADSSRILILLMLAEGEKNVTEICKTLGQTQPAISHHLALLRVSGVVESDRRGKHNFYSLRPAGQTLVKALRQVQKDVAA